MTKCERRTYTEEFKNQMVQLYRSLACYFQLRQHQLNLMA